ncbi:hypothetical protein ACFXKX_26695 [Streptomyces scopuliridis]|uniref:hypothetical protein n=1 Tax=Streptomyces scopuliridis TaxID=452529 RepID=UPI003691E29D
MSAQEPEAAGHQEPATGEKPAYPAVAGPEGQENAAEGPDQPQEAWAARRDLYDHTPAPVHGFAPKLAEVLHTMHGMELQARYHTAAAAGKPPADPGTLAQLLATHPDYPTRLLRPYLQPRP